MESAFMCCQLMTQLKASLGKQEQHGANSVMSDLMDTDYVAECLTVFHGNGAAIDRIRTDFTSGCRPSTY